MAHYCTYRSNRSPPKKTPLSPDAKQVPFRSANPSQLQEVTLGTPLDYLGEGTTPSNLFRVAAARQLSPIRGRTMKEYDQQIAELKNDNFNLKLRIYFLEERIQHQFGDSSNDVFKNNIELKVEVESLKKELAERQELLVKASNALEVLETTRKTEKSELEQRFAEHVNELEGQIQRLKQALDTGVQDLKGSQYSSDDGSRDELYKQAFPPLPSTSNLPQGVNMVDLKAKIGELQSLVDSLNSNLTDSQNQIQRLENQLSEKERHIQEEELNNLKRNKLIQGLVSAVKTKEKQITQLQADLEGQASELKSAKEQLNGVLKGDAETNMCTQSSPNAAAAGDCWDQLCESTKTDLHESELEELCREKQKLEAAWRDAVKQRDETIQAMQADLQKQLQNKEELVQELRQAIADRDGVLLDCLKLVGDLDTLEHTKDLSSEKITEVLKIKLLEKEYKVQTLFEEKMKLVKEKENELTKESDTSVEKDQSFVLKMKEATAAQQSVTTLQSELAVRDVKIQELLEFVRTLRSQIEESLKIVGDKDSMIDRLQKSLVDTDKKLEDVCLIQGSSHSLTSNSFVVENRIIEKDKLIETLISEKSKCLMETEKTAQSYASALREKDIALKEAHSKLMNEQAAHEEETEQLKAELKKKVNEIKNLTNQQQILQEKLQTILNEKRHRLQCNEDDPAQDDSSQNLISFNSPVAVSEITPNSLAKEAEALREKLLAKEEFILHIKEYLEKLLHDTADDKCASKLRNASSSNDSSEKGALEQKLCDVEARLKSSWNRNKQLESYLAGVRTRLVHIKMAAKMRNNTNGSLEPTFNELPAGDIEDDLQSLHQEVKMLVNTNDLFQRQIELTAESRNSFNPQLIIEMAVEIQQLTAALERRRTEQFSCVAEENQSTPYQRMVFGPSSQPMKRFSPVVDSSVLIESTQQENSRFSFGVEPPHMQTSMVVVLQDAQREIKHLQEKLASTENTVHVLGNKVKYYRHLLAEAGVSAISPVANGTDTILMGADSHGSREISCDSQKLHRLDTSQPIAVASSRRSVSVDELTVLPTSVTLHQGSQAMSADDVLTAEHLVAPNSTVGKTLSDQTQDGEKKPSREETLHSQQIISSLDGLEKPCQKDGSRIKNLFENLARTESHSCATASSYTPDSVADYGQSNDLLELKEQICWLKLRLEERDVQLHELMTEKDVSLAKTNVVFPSTLNNSDSIYLQEQSLTFSNRNASRIISSVQNGTLSSACRTASKARNQTQMIDAECQVGVGIVAPNYVQPLDSPDEVQWLRHQNTMLEARLSSLTEIVPEERNHSSQYQHQEIAVIRHRLCESHDSCELLRIRLEELAEFLEQLLRFDENGILDASRLTPQRIASLRRHIAESRELSQNLSQSLLVDLDLSVVSSIDRVINQTHVTLLNTDDDSDVTSNRTCRAAELNSTIRNSPSRDDGSCFGTPKCVASNQLHDPVVLGLSISKLRNELGGKNELVIKLRSQVQLLQEQIRQRDIENSWNHVERQSGTRHPSSIMGSDRTVEKARNATQSFLTTASVVADMEGEETLHISVLGNDQSPSPEASCISKGKELEWRSGSACQPRLSELDSRDRQPNLEALWLNSNNDNSNSDDMKPFQSSYDDLILLLDAEQDPPARSARSSSNQRAIRDERQTIAEHRTLCHDYQPDSSNPEIRTLEAQQEQAIMAEYVRHYTSRPFIDENTHSTFRAMAAFLSPTDQIPEKERSSRLKPRIAATPSDSESWSEPDRDVSQQRMGLEPEASGEKPGIVGRSPKTCRQKMTGSGSSNVGASSEEMIRISKRLYSPSGRKSRSDPWDLRRLLARLQNLEELNATLRSELQIHQSLSKDICNTSSRRQSDCVTRVVEDDGKSCKATSALHITETRKSADTIVDKTGIMLQEHLEEIRALRLRLEESIKINDQLQEKLEKRLASKQIKIETKSVKESNDEVDQLCNQLELKDQMIAELQRQVEFYLKLSPKQETEVQQLKQQVYHLSSKIQDLEDQVPQLQRELTDKDEASQQLKNTNQRLQGSLVNMQTALMDKDRVNKEVREANSRMQRALDAVNKLMQQRDVEIRTAQGFSDQLRNELKTATQKHIGEITKLTAMCSEKAREVQEREKLCRDSAQREVNEIRHKHREELDSLQKVLESKLKQLDEALHISEDLNQQLVKKEEESQLMQKKFDEMTVAVMELEKQLEREHGQCLSLQQKLNTLNKAMFEKENAIFHLQDKMQEHQARLEEAEHERDVGHNQLVQLQAAMASSQHDSAEREQELVSLKMKLENLQEVASEKKRALDIQVDRAHSLEQKIDQLNALTSAKEEKYKEDETVAIQLRQSLTNSEKQALDTKNELKKSQDSCKVMQNRLLEQEKVYMSLQEKLDERSTSIRKLEEELHQAWEDNEKLQQQVLALQTRLQETSDLNKSMKTELNVYEHLHASISSCNSASTSRRVYSSKQTSLDLNLLLQEIRSLRSQLELSIQTNCALRAQLEEQFNYRSSDVAIIEIPSARRLKCRGNAKDSKKGLVQSGDQNSMPNLERVCSSPSHFVPEKDDNSNDEIKKRNRLSWNDSPTEGHIDSDNGPSATALLKPHLADSGNFSEHDCNAKISFARQQSKSSDYVSEDPAGFEDDQPPSSSVIHDTMQEKTKGVNRLVPGLILSDSHALLSPEEIHNNQTDSHSIYSSPDLGIESDPNHFSSLERKMSHITDDHLWQIRESRRKHNREEKLANVSYSIHDPYPQELESQVGVDSDRRLLYAIGRLDDYELLKKEVEESLVLLKGVQSRLKDCLRTCPKASPTKSLEQVTLKELQNSSANLQICLGKSLDIIGCFWTAMLPQDGRKDLSSMESKKLHDEIALLKKKFHQQKKTLNAALQKLAATNRLKEGMEKAITKQLSKTHDVLKKAKGNLTDNSAK